MFFWRFTGCCLNDTQYFQNLQHWHTEGFSKMYRHYDLMVEVGESQLNYTGNKGSMSGSAGYLFRRHDNGSLLIRITYLFVNIFKQFLSHRCLKVLII